MKNIKKQILITFGLLLIYWLGHYLPVLGINYYTFASFFKQIRADGALHRLTIFSLGIMPYISAHIIILLLTAVVPYFRRMGNKDRFGNKKFNHSILFVTILLSIIQSFFLSMWILKFRTVNDTSLVLLPSPIFQLLVIITMTLGTIIIIWMGRVITNFGIGNGISLFVFIGIISKFSNGISNVWKYSIDKGYIMIFLFSLGIILILLGVAKFMLEYEKKLKVRYLGHKIENINISLSFDLAGIVPILFASWIWLFPATLTTLQGKETFISKIASFLQQGTVANYLIYGALIIFFTFFYTAVVFNPLHLSEKMKKFRVFIPNIKQGKTTAKFLDNMLIRITLVWGSFLFIISTILVILPYWLKIPSFNLDGANLILLAGIAFGSWHSLRDRLKFESVFFHTDLKQILLAKGLLESEGIESVVMNEESFGRLLGLTVGPLAEKKLLVKRSDVSQAKELVFKLE